MNAMKNTPDNLDVITKKIAPDSNKLIEEIDRKFGGFNASKISWRSRLILEEGLSMSNIKDTEGKNALQLDANAGTTMMYNNKEVSSIVLDGLTQSVELAHATKSIPSVYTFEVKTQEKNGDVTVEYFSIKMNPTSDNSSVDDLLMSIGVDISEKPRNKISLPREMDQFLNNVETVDDKMKLTFLSMDNIILKAEKSSDGKRGAIENMSMNGKEMILDADTLKIDYLGKDNSGFDSGKYVWHHFRLINKDGSTQDFSLMNNGGEVRIPRIVNK